MALIASGRTVRVWLDIIYAFGCFLPGLMNYIPLVYREYNLFWRQNVMLTAWYQVFIATLLNIGGIINILVYGNCRDDEYHDNFDECEDILVLWLIIIIIIFVGQIGFMCHLAYSANNFLQEYLDENKEELEAQKRLMFNAGKDNMRNSVKDYARNTGSSYQPRPPPTNPSPSNLVQPLNGSGRRNDFSAL